MLTHNMQFPATFDTVNGAGVVVIILGEAGGTYYGYSTNKKYSSATKSVGVWDHSGNCLFINNSVATKESRKLVPMKTEAQKLYEKLDADGKALARLVGDTSMALLATYLRDKTGTKVDVNLAISVYNVGQKVEWK